MKGGLLHLSTALVFVVTKSHMFWFCLQAARDPEIGIPPEKVSLVYGMACSIHFLLPAAYFLSAKFEGQPNHFESAVLSAVNSGGNNMARAALTGSARAGCM